MQNAAGDGIEVQPDDPDDAYRSVVSDLVSLLGHVQASLKRIESAVAGETSAITTAPPTSSSWMT
jgi:hypothetical protein